MMKRLFLLLGIAVGVLFYALGIALIQRDKAMQERDRYKGNAEALLNDVRMFAYEDSLSGAEVGMLRLRIDELKRYRADDYATIKRLQGRNSELQNFAKMQTQTIASIKGMTRDSIVYVDCLRVDTLRCVRASDAYMSFDGCVNQQGEFDGTFVSKDTLMISAFVKYKRFLGFLWRTNKVKERRVDVISRNPHTKIGGAEYIEVYY